jgi:hypothetical protein
MWREQQAGRISGGENGKETRVRIKSRRNSSLYKDDGLEKVQRAFNESSADW